MASTDVASTLTQDEIPVKLRCASCNKLVLNAFRLPCCDQNVCETCQTSLPESCPVCMHNPLSAADCKPNKTLRLTVKAFLKNEEKKRDKKSTESENRNLSNGARDESQFHGEVDQTAKTQDNGDEIEKGNAPAIEPAYQSKSTESPTGEQEEEIDETAPSSPSSSVEITLETPEERQQNSQSFWTTHPSDNARKQQAGIEEQGVQSVERSRDEASAQQNGESFVNQNQNLGTGFGFDGMGNFNNWQNMGQNMGQYNPMMLMQNGMQGMQGGPWTAFPNMMGMAGMGMDPMMMSQGMFGGFNGQNMGMNGMNMGMGFDGGYGNWLGQPSMGMGNMNGDWGANSGYYPSSGYNQHSRQGYQMNSYKGNRFNGQGFRGDFRRDQTHFSRFQNRSYSGNKDVKPPMHQQTQFNSRASELKGVQDNFRPAVDATTPVERNYETVLPPNDGEPSSEQSPSEKQQHSDLVPLQRESNAGSLSEVTPADLPENTTIQRELENAPRSSLEEQRIDSDHTKDLRPIAPVDSYKPQLKDVSQKVVNEDSYSETSTPISPATNRRPSAHPDSPTNTRTGYSAHGISGASHDSRGTLRGRGSSRFGSSQEHARSATTNGHVSTHDQLGQGVIGAPTGPKAMRDGQGNVGIRGRGGISIVGRGSKPLIPTAPRNMESSKALNRDPRNSSRSRSRSPERSRTENSDKHYRQSRSRSPLVNGNEDTYEDRKARRRHRSRREAEEVRDADYTSDVSVSRDDTRRSRHRAKENREDHVSLNHVRERSRDRRRKRQRSRSPVREELSRKSDINYNKRKYSDKYENGVGNELERRISRRDTSVSPSRQRNSHRSSRSVMEPPAEKPPVREFKIKDRSKRAAQESHKEPEPLPKADVDPNTLEREARNRDRMLREQQRRRQSMATGNDKKRSRGMMEDSSNVNGVSQSKISLRKARHDSSSGRSHRKMSYHYEDDENEEARASRIESEREAARWE